MDEELKELIEAQLRDDTNYARPQRFGAESGGQETLSIDAYLERGEHEDYVGAGLAMSAEEEYLASLDDGGQDFETEVLARLTEDERTLYLRVFGEGLSLREVEALTGRSKSSVLRDVEKLRIRLADILEAVL